VIGDHARRAAGGRNNVDAVAGTIGHGAGDGEPFAVGREAVTAVAADGRAGVDGLRCSAAVDGDGEHVAVLIEDERAAVAGPVGRLDAYARGVDHGGANGVGVDFDGLEGARKSELRSRAGGVSGVNSRCEKAAVSTAAGSCAERPTPA